MCLYVDSAIPNVAKQDITVWKVVLTNGETWTGPYFYDFSDFPFNQVVKANSCLFSDNDVYKATGYYTGEILYEINGGHFHSYISKDTCLELLCELHVEVKGYIMKKVKMHIEKFNSLKMCKCTIPKGTEYYRDGDCFASKKLIVHKPTDGVAAASKTLVSCRPYEM